MGRGDLSVSANPLLEQRSRAVQAAVVTFPLLEMPADNELSAILNRRNQINDTLDNGGEVKQRYAKVSVYTEFTEFTRKEIKDFETKFTLYNVSGSGTISLQELKIMMEKLGAPQTHLGLKAMIKEVDEDDDSAISFREFLMIFRKARMGELDMESGLGKLASLSEVDVDAVGVGGAKTFFEAKIAEVSKGSKFAEEIREEQEEKKREEEVTFKYFFVHTSIKEGTPCWLRKEGLINCCPFCRKE